VHDRRTGNILWRRAVAVEKIENVHQISSPAGPTPATDGERVYVYFGSCGLLCYDLDGNLKWERRLPLPENPYGATASPIVAGELLVLNHQGKDAYLLAVNRRDGRTVWRTDRSAFKFGWSTPVHWRHDGIDEIVVLGGDFEPNQRLVAYDLATGAERWWVAGLPPCGKSTPVIGGGMVFLTAPDIILEQAAEKRNPEKAAQFYARNKNSLMAVRPGSKVKLRKQISPGRTGEVYPAFLPPCTTTDAFILSRTAGWFTVEKQTPESCCMTKGWELSAITTPRAWLPTIGSTLPPPRAW